jgi:hypothetical protein
VDQLSQQLTVGGALFIASLYLLLKFKPWLRANGNGPKLRNPTGELDPAEWEKRIRMIIVDALQSHESQLREIVREELRDRTGRAP